MTINRTVPPSVSDIKSFNILKARKLILENGIPYYYLNAENTELVKIELMFSAGNWFQQSPMTAFAVNNMLIEGAGNYTSAQIAEMAEYFGAYIGYNVDKDNAYVSLFTLRKYLPEVLPLLENIVKSAVFPQHEIDQFKKKHKQQFQVEQTKVKNIARAVHGRMIFGNQHPYGYMITEEDFDNIHRDELLEFHHHFYSSPNCTIIASGAINDKDAHAIGSHFGKGNWNNTNPVGTNSFQVIPEKEQKVYIEKPDAMQSAVRIGKEIFTRQHPDYVALSVVNCILGGYFGSRLMKTIREEKGYTYGINSLLVTFLHSGYISIVSELGAQVTKPALADIYAEIERLRTERVSGEELQRVKNYMLGEVVRMFDGPFAQAESLILLLENNFSYEYFDQLISEIKSVSAEKIEFLAKKHLDPASFFEVVVGRMD